MTDRDDRREQSFETEDTRYERELEEDVRERHEAAERLAGEPLSEPEDR